MVVQVTVPLLGEGIEEVTIVKWLKSEGDLVEKHEALLEVETDKVVTEVIAPEAGTLLRIETSREGDIIPVGAIVAWIGEPGEAIPEQIPTQTGKSDLTTGKRVVSQQGLDLSPGPGAKPDLIPHSITRRRIAEHMVLSRRTAPHATTVMEADLTRVVAHRQSHQADFAKEGIRLTFTAYFVAAAAKALRAFPIVNASWEDEGIRLHPHIHIGIATDLGEEGLIVPVLKNADQLTLRELAGTINNLAARARQHQLQPEDVHGGTFTITNHGISGSLFAMPIIHQSQCAILGIGVIQKRAVVLPDEKGGDTLAIRPMVYLTLTFDHRILDGALADHFLAEVVKSLQNW